MAKIKNEDYIRDAKIILDDIDTIDNLNRSSSAISRQARVFLEKNDGRYAFDWACRAKYMHDFLLTQSKILSEPPK